MMQRIVTMATLAFAMPVFAAGPNLSLTVAGRYATGVFDEGAAEIVAFDAGTGRAFVVNANDQTVDVLALSGTGALSKVGDIDVASAGSSLGAANSVAVYAGLVAVAIEAADKQANGIVAFYDAATLALLGTVGVGALPDMLTFTPDGSKVLVANEGEPDDDYVVDPEGTVSIIELSRGVGKARVTTVSFKSYNGKKDELIAAGVRIFGPNATVAQDLEPEYIGVRPNGDEAFVALQENNALAKIDIKRGKVTDIVPLGYKDHSLAANKLDPSDRDSGIELANWPVFGMYQPDGIAVYEVDGETYVVTANEGDSRDYDGYVEETRLKDLGDFGLALDPNVFPNADDLDDNDQLGRLNITIANGDADGDGLLEEIYAFGARSFSIRDKRGRLVYDSGSLLEDITAALLPAYFNASNDNNELDNRSDNKGPEPEGIDVGWIDGRAYAFIGLERIGGLMVFEITDPTAPEFETYVNNRDFTQDPCLNRDGDDDCITGSGQANPAALDNGPEGVKFVPAADSPTGKDLVLVGNEISGSTTVYEITLTN